MSSANRRYDIDWLRVIAIGLLLIYHVSIGFQPWGIMIGFITNKQPWGSLWIPMAILNVWRIPLLFFVSGMGVYFAIRQRSWKQLLQERTMRILIPYLFGMFAIYPVSIYIWQSYYHFDRSYSPNPGHLWFLGNIFAYVVLLMPVFFYLKQHENGRIGKWIKRMLSNPLGLLPVVAVFVAEVLLVKPNPYELYAMTWHGFILGLLAFFFGFCFVFSGSSFRGMLQKWRWLFLTAAVALFIHRATEFQMRAPGYLLPIESCCWVFTVLAFGHKHLNHPGKALQYLSEAAYPVYIVHMIFLYLGSLWIFPLDIGVHLKYVLVLAFTFAGCFAAYEFIIRRVNIIRPLFGLKSRRTPEVVPAADVQ